MSQRSVLSCAQRRRGRGDGRNTSSTRHCAGQRKPDERRRRSRASKLGERRVDGLREAGSFGAARVREVGRWSVLYASAAGFAQGSALSELSRGDVSLANTSAHDLWMSISGRVLSSCTSLLLLKPMDGPAGYVSKHTISCRIRFPIPACPPLGGISDRMLMIKAYR